MMEEKYINAICILGEMLTNRNDELKWKRTLIELKDKEIEKLKAKLECMEQNANDVSNRK